MSLRVLLYRSTLKLSKFHACLLKRTIYKYLRYPDKLWMACMVTTSWNDPRQSAWSASTCHLLGFEFCDVFYGKALDLAKHAAEPYIAGKWRKQRKKINNDFNDIYTKYLEETKEKVKKSLTKHSCICC